MAVADRVVKPSLNAQARAAITRERPDIAAHAAQRGLARAPAQRDGQGDALVERAFAEILGAHIGLGDPGADAPAIGEFACQRHRGTLVAGQIAADIQLRGNAVLEFVIGRDMAGRDLIVAEAEDIAEVAFADAVDLGAKGQGRALAFTPASALSGFNMYVSSFCLEVTSFPRGSVSKSLHPVNKKANDAIVIIKYFIFIIFYIFN